MNRCLNDFFGYCSSEPEPYDCEGYDLSYDYRGHQHKQPTTYQRCKLWPDTCTHHLTFGQVFDLLMSKNKIAGSQQAPKKR